MNTDNDPVHALLSRWRDDPAGKYRTWFPWEERLKNWLHPPRHRRRRRRDRSRQVRQRLQGLLARELERRGIQRSRSNDAAALVADALKNSLADERGCWLLGPDPDARSEHCLRLRNERGLRSYVIDRLFRDVAGERWIVDFKTSRHEGGGFEQLLDEQRTHYEPQLNAYAAAFDRSHMGLYFLLQRGWREWRS